MKLIHHWVADIFPLNDSDIDRLAEDIKANGLRQPIIAWGEQIIDGRTRLAACKKAGVEPIIEQYTPENGEPTDEELLALSWSLNETRRHLTTSQRACAAAEVAEKLGIQRGGDSKSKVGKPTLKGTAKNFGVGRDAVIQARELLCESPDLFQQVKRGDLTVGSAHESFRKLKELEKAEVRRNSLAEISGKDPDLAEQVENGKITVDEAQQQLEAEALEQRRRIEDLGKIMTGVFVALSGLKMANEALRDMRATVTEAVATRQPHQLKDDRKRLADAIATLSDFLEATNERK